MADSHNVGHTIAQAQELGLATPEIRSLLLRTDVLMYFFQSRRVVKHALGFTQLQLGEFNGRAVRLHLWPRCNGVAAENTSEIHSHPWPLRSFVLSGSIINRTYRVFESNQEVGELYEVRRHEDRTIHTKLDIGVTWEVQSLETVQTGSDYSVEVSKFHSSTFTTTGAVTIIIAGERGKSLARVVKPLSAPRIITRTPVLLTETEKRQTLAQVLTMLQHIDGH